MRGAVSRAAALVLAAIVAWGAWTPAGAAPPVWRLRAGGAEVVLFGSVHVLSPGLDWRTPRLMADLARARSVWFEIPLDDPSRQKAAALAGTEGRLADGRTLSGLLSPEARARLERVATGLGLPPASLDGYRPWLAEVTLTLLQLRRQGADQGAGVEEVLSRAAPADARRSAFETPEEQVRLLADTPLAEQVSSLEETLRQMEDEPQSFDALEKAWVAADLGWIEREAVEPLKKASPDLYGRLVTDRNRRWADRIAGLLEAGESAFVVVGVGHLVGPDGVPALLRRKGVAVEGP